MTAPYTYAPEYGARFVLTAPNPYTAGLGFRAVFNDSADANWVGALTDATGQDSADVRDGGDVLVAADGGWAGGFYYGRRPITLPGTIYGHSTVAQRNQKMSYLMSATNAMAADGTISWLPSWAVSNLIPNPNMEYGTAGWGAASHGPYTLSSSTAWSAAGTKSLRIVGNTGFTTYVFVMTNSYNGQNITSNIVQNTVYNYGATLNAVAGTAVQLAISWYDSYGNYISENDITMPASLGVHVLSGSVTSPAGAVSARVQIGQTAAGALDLSIDQVFLSRESVSYLDGDQTGNFWWGTPGNSPSGNCVEMFT